MFLNGLVQDDAANGIISRAEPSRAEPSRAEPSRAEPSRAEPSRAEPSRAEPSRAEPSRAEPSRAEPSRARDCASGSEGAFLPIRVSAIRRPRRGAPIRAFRPAPTRSFSRRSRLAWAGRSCLPLQTSPRSRWPAVSPAKCVPPPYARRTSCGSRCPLRRGRGPPARQRFRSLRRCACADRNLVGYAGGGELGRSGRFWYRLWHAFRYTVHIQGQIILHPVVPYRYISSDLVPADPWWWWPTQ